MGRYNDTELKILRFSRKGGGCGEGKNLFSREKKDNGADVRPPPRDTIYPCREQRVLKKALFIVSFREKMRRNNGCSKAAFPEKAFRERKIKAYIRHGKEK